MNGFAEILVTIIILTAVVYLLLWFLNHLSYSLFKNRVLRKQKWDLNICCGKTDGGGINADIMPHLKVPCMTIVDIYTLPFRNNQFNTVLCSHTIEHTDDPGRFYSELKRVGKYVTLVIPPLWDISAVLNIIEHRWIFLSFKKEHNTLPKYVRLPFSGVIQKLIGQRVSA